MGRPPKPRTELRKPQSVWLTDAETEAMKNAASKADVSPRDWLRNVVLVALGQPLVTTPVVVLPEGKLAEVSENVDPEFCTTQNYYGRSSFAPHQNSDDLSHRAEGTPSSSPTRHSSPIRAVSSATQERSSAGNGSSAPSARHETPSSSGVSVQPDRSAKSGSDPEDLDGPRRTRAPAPAPARPLALSNGSEKPKATSRDLVSSKQGSGEAEVQGSSLRSDQRAALPSTEVPEPWEPVTQSKLSVTLADGTKATAIWLSSSAFKLTSPDTTRILAYPAGNVLRKAMLRGYATALRQAYIRRWCAAMSKKTNAWHDTPKGLKAFESAAEYLAREFASRGMTPDQYIDACHELRPKSLKFPTPDMLSFLQERIAMWVPPDQRAVDNPWGTHEDAEGQTWVRVADDPEPVPVIRTAQDRDRLLRKLRG